MIEKMIVDADICIKLGGSSKYRYLYDILPLIAEQIYMHTHAYGEVLMPLSAVEQLRELVSAGIIKLVDERSLDRAERAVFELSYHNLSKVMIDPRKPNKNKGEACSLAYAKSKSIPVFATDEKNLQPIIDAQLNTGLDDITCIRIVDIIEMAQNGELDIPRKICKALWLVAGKRKETFDQEIWPVKKE